MFDIGSKKWPGISKLIEECGEVLQVCGKLMATRGGVEHWDGTDLKERLQNELGDLIAAIEFVINHGNLDFNAIYKRRDDKLARFARWHELGDTNQKAILSE